MELLLLSGGLESAALAAWRRPDFSLTIDYGQRPARGEATAAAAVCRALGLQNELLHVDCSQIGSGLLAGDDSLPDAPSPEWWAYRNQLLVTLACAWGLPRGVKRVCTGSIASDGERHVDGRADFYAALAQVVAMQEGSIHVEAPAIGMTSAELLEASGISDSVLGWTHSCHTSNLACGSCPGCVKRQSVLTETGRLR